VTASILVVGGYGAVGRALCRDLAAHGYLPVIAGRHPEKGAELAHGLGTTCRRLDISDPAAGRPPSTASTWS